MKDESASAVRDEGRYRLASRGITAKITGEHRFLTDPHPGWYWAALIRSPHPRADVRSVDVTHIARLEGVEAVFTWEDVPDTRFNTALVPSDDWNLAADKRLLTQRPRHVGDGVAVVVARTRREARAAAEAAQVQWIPRQPVLSLEQALSAGRVVGRVTVANPGAVELLARAPVVVSDRFEFGAAQHTCLEPHACAAQPGIGPVMVEVWTNSQCPSEVRRLVAHITGLSEPSVRVRKVDEGGGFGGKQDMFEEALVAWLALRLQRPVRLAFTRREELTAGRVHGAGRIDLAMGFDMSGDLIASDMSAVLDSGAYASHTPYVLSCLSGHLTAVYPRAQHSFAGIAVSTNTIPAGAYRGYGVADANFAAEQLMDVAAARLAMNPTQIRLRNLIAGSDGRGAAVCLQMLGLPQHGKKESRADRRGMGLAIAAKHSVASPDASDQSVAEVTLLPGPVIVLTTGTCDSGTGSSRALARIVSEDVGVPMDQILIQEGDSAVGGTDIGSTAQRSVFVGGAAVRAAALRLQARILQAAAVYTGRSGLAISWPHVVDSAMESVCALNELATAWPAGTLTGRATGHAPGNGASYCALSVDVAVDDETGEVRVERVVAVVDCGRVIDLEGARGQVTGGIVQGIGLACTDEWVAGPGGNGPGRILLHGVPRATTAPEMDVMFVRPDRDGPACGLGELPIVPVAAAIANALAAATNVRGMRLPMRAGELWSRIHDFDQAPI